jgi:nucleoside-diphosphate-sugar epimerase
MNVILFGATGMVGQGVLRECLRDPEVTVLSIVRTATGRQHERLREIVHRDFLDFSAIQGELAGFHACFFCPGISSVGMKEADYYRVTYEITMAAAQLLAALNPGMTRAGRPSSARLP